MGWGRGRAAWNEEKVKQTQREGGDAESGRLLMAGAVELGAAAAGHHLQAQLNRLGPVLTDHARRRIDRPLQVNKAAVERIKKGSLCYYFYLRGRCTTKCSRNQCTVEAGTARKMLQELEGGSRGR